jgi:hypothetical protein
LILVSPTQSQVQAALREFLLAVLPEGAGEAAFSATIAGGIMTVLAMDGPGTIGAGDPVLGPGVAPGTTVRALGTGAGVAGTYAVSPPQTIGVQTTMSTFVDVVAAQDNRVPEPASPDFIVMTPIRRPRLSTNIDTYADVAFTASIAGSVMTVSTIQIGAIAAGTTLFGTGVVPGTQITALSGGTGGPGTYAVSPPQSVPAQPMAAGGATFLQPTEFVVQLDVHGPNSGDNAQIISTLFRDAFGVDAFAALNAAVSPLYADDPNQTPFINAEQQFETRWTVDAHLQVNEVVAGVPQQFAGVIAVGLVEVEAAYKP